MDPLLVYFSVYMLCRSMSAEQMAKTCILSDGLVIKIDEFEYPLCYLFKLVVISRKFLSHFKIILHCVLKPLPE